MGLGAEALVVRQGRQELEAGRARQEPAEVAAVLAPTICHRNQAIQT
ncbi:hypothetical protein [Enterocloster lavalensis]|nr:hypothetical protein [Enterocloster lavalensis]